MPASHRSTHFFCCAIVNTNQIPSLEESMSLQTNGLGKKKVRFCDVKCTPQQCLIIIEESFPLLKACWIRCCRSRQLIDIVMPPEGYSVKYLKETSNLNKAVAYIVPLQCDLPLTGDIQKVSCIGYFFVFSDLLCDLHFRMTV